MKIGPAYTRLLSLTLKHAFCSTKILAEFKVTVNDSSGRIREFEANNMKPSPYLTAAETAAITRHHYKPLPKSRQSYIDAYTRISHAKIKPRRKSGYNVVRINISMF